MAKPVIPEARRLQLGQRLARARAAQGLSQRQLGAELGSTGQYVHLIEHGTLPGPAMLVRIARALSLPEAAILSQAGYDGARVLERLERQTATA